MLTLFNFDCPSSFFSIHFILLLVGYRQKRATIHLSKHSFIFIYVYFILRLKSIINNSKFIRRYRALKLASILVAIGRTKIKRTESKGVY